MLEVTFQNQLKDIDSFIHYMANTNEGRNIGKSVFYKLQLSLLGIASMLKFLFDWTINSQVGTISFFVFLTFFEILIFWGSKFKPIYSYAKQPYLEQINKLTEKQKKLITIPKKLTANEDYIEISSEFSLRRCSWVCVEKIVLTSNFIFIFIGGVSTSLIPKRVFASEQEFNGFGGNLLTLKQNFDTRNIENL